MIFLLHGAALVALLLSGAIFGFFYAWVCSTMWGLDAAEPAVAIEAMQAMNASVRNAVFAPAFFGTPFVLLAAAGLAFASRLRMAAIAFGAASLVYVLGGLILTMAVNVPMNDALAAINVPADPQEARRLWQEYSAPWQFWNVVRTIASGVTLALIGLALLAMNRRTA